MNLSHCCGKVINMNENNFIGYEYQDVTAKRWL